jgi:tetratricopeptide (TPR) repeat protein
MARAQAWVSITVTAIAEGGPYAPLVDAIEQLLGRNRGLLDSLPDRVRSVLAELTMLAAPAPPLQGPLTRHQVIGAMRRLLLEVADATGIALVVDDAHLADDAATDALLHLAGVSGGGRLLLVVCYRPELAREVLSRGVARLIRAGAADAIDLEPLDPEDAAALVKAASPTSPDAKTVARIVDLAGGNPFFILELARNAVAGLPLGVTATVWDAVATRFVDLGDRTRSMVQRLAVAGDEFDTAGVLAVTGLPEPEAFALLDAALSAEVLVVSETRYRFRHELVRRALVEQVPPHRRMAVHRDAARRMATAGGTPDVIASHWLAGGRPDEAITWLLAAARHAVKLGAFGGALEHLESLLRHAPGHVDGLCLRAEALEALGDERAPAAFAVAARVVSKPAWHDIRAKQALASVRAGDPAAAIAALEGVEATTLDGRLSQALALCGAAAMGFADPSVGVAMAAETRRLAVESGDPAAIVIASWAEASAAHARGDLPRTLRAGLRKTYALPDLAITVFDGQLCVAERLLYGGQPYADAIAFADALGAEAERLGAARGQAFATTFRGEAKLLSGRLDEADDDLATGARLHHAIGAAAGEALSLQRRAEVALYRGELSQADTLLDESLDRARESNLGFHLLDRIYGTRIAAAADPTSAMAALEAAESAVRGSMETCPGCRITLAVPAAIAAAQAGDLERAVRYESAAEKLTTILMRLPGWYAALDEVKGHRARATGDIVAAGGHFAAASSGFRKAGQPLDADRCDQWAANQP